MSISDIFHLECDPVEPRDALNHAVFSCMQWKDPSLGVMAQAARQSFAVMYGGSPNCYVTAAIERAYVLGAMSAVKLIAVHEDTLHLFLDSGVSSATFQEIETLWALVVGMSRIRLEVDFASVSEVYSGRSDYLFWQDAKEILESYALGIEQYDLASMDIFPDLPSIDEFEWPYLSQGDDGQPGETQDYADTFRNVANMMGHSKCVMAPYYIHPNHQRKPIT
jgi:hypothetical protein